MGSTLAGLILENHIQATHTLILKDVLVGVLTGTPTMRPTSVVVLHTLSQATRVTGNEVSQALLPKPVITVLD